MELFSIRIQRTFQLVSTFFLVTKLFLVELSVDTQNIANRRNQIRQYSFF